MTDREKAIVMAYTGYCMLEGDKLGIYYRYLEKKFGRPVQTLEISSMHREIQMLAKEDFISLCRDGK